MNPVTWRVAAASVCGTSHEKSGQPCQDAQGWALQSDGTLVIAVADGAGSAAFAEVGAAVAVRTAVEFLSARLTSDEAGSGGPAGEDTSLKALLTDAVRAARAAVEAEAVSRNTTARELASTFLLVLARPGCLAAAQIGDGAVVVADVNGGCFPVTTPAHGEYLNETTFLISPGALDKLQLIVWRGPLAHLAVFSDGLQMLALKMPGGVPHPPFFAPLFRFLSSQPDEDQAQASLLSFLTSPRLRERADDDLTLVLAALVP